MNILFVAYNLYPCNTGGTEIFNYHLIKELAKSHKIFILTCCKEKIDLDAVIIRINRRQFGKASISISLLSFINIMKLRNKIDLIHLPYMSPDWPAWIPILLANKILNIPFIISIRGGGMRKWIPEFPYQYLFRNAAEIIGVSTRLKDEYEKRTGRKLKYVPSGLPFKVCGKSRSELRGKYGLGLSDVIIVSVSSIQKLKGSDVLLSAFFKLGEKYVRKHNLKLVFVGDGKMRKELEEKTKEENFGKYVKFSGNVPYGEIPSFYKIADIYIIASLFEGMSNSMLEAMFNKKTIIGSDASGISNMIEHGKNGLLFELNNSDDLRDKIVYLIENRNVAEKMAQEAKSTYNEKYKYESVVNQYIEIYETVGRMQEK